MQQGKTAEGEAAERQLWGRLKLEESFIATKATNSSAEEDANWRDLFGKRYHKGTKMNSCSNNCMDQGTGLLEQGTASTQL